MQTIKIPLLLYNISKTFTVRRKLSGESYQTPLNLTSRAFKEIVSQSMKFCAGSLVHTKLLLGEVLSQPSVSYTFQKHPVAFVE